VRLTSPPSCAECHEIWEPKPPGTLWATPGLLKESFTSFTYQEGDANVLHNHFLPCFFNLITYNHLQGQKKLHNTKQLRFIVLTAVTRMMALCRNVTPCSSIHCYGCFIGTPALIFFFPELGGSHIPLKSHYLSTKQHHITFLKTAMSTKHMFTITKKLVLANLTLSRIT